MPQYWSNRSTTSCKSHMPTQAAKGLITSTPTSQQRVKALRCLLKYLRLILPCQQQPALFQSHPDVFAEPFSSPNRKNQKVRLWGRRWGCCPVIQEGEITLCPLECADVWHWSCVVSELESKLTTILYWMRIHLIIVFCVSSPTTSSHLYKVLPPFLVPSLAQSGAGIACRRRTC